MSAELVVVWSVIACTYLGVGAALGLYLGGYEWGRGRRLLAVFMVGCMTLAWPVVLVVIFIGAGIEKIWRDAVDEGRRAK